MTTATAPPPPPPPPQSQEQMTAAVAVNAIRLQAIVDRLKVHFRGGAGALPASELAHLVYALARGIDYALSSNDVPHVADQIPLILSKVYQHRNDPLLQCSVIVLVISCKNACHNNWFQPTDSTDILKMANELSSSFCTSLNQEAYDSNVPDIVSTIMPRYYPHLKFERLITSLEAKMGYDILMSDFFIERNLPRDQKITLVVVQSENLDASSCITGPQHASFLVNGKGVDKRTNVSMEMGPQFPTDITKMLKYGTNIIQAVGYFNANYIIAIAYISNLTSFDAPKLDDYVQPITADPPDSDILEGPSRVSLNCPISFRRIKTPIKGRLCKHYQCFDYDNYMEMNLRKPTWRCPCCNTPSSCIDLRIDKKMAKILQEARDDTIDVLIFVDGSWKAASAPDEKSNGHASAVIGQKGNVVETDGSPSDVIDLINGNDDGDLSVNLSQVEPLPEKHTNLSGNATSASEDIKPLYSQNLSVTDFISSLLTISTPAQAQDLYVGNGNNGLSNAISTSGQNLLLSSTGGLGSRSIGTLESILPQDILRPVITDAVSPSLETSVSTLATHPVSQGTQHPEIVQLQPPIDPLLGSEVARPLIPRNIRREPVAIQALPVPLQNSGSSRRVQPNVFNCPPPIPLSSPASSTFQALQVTNSDCVVTATNSGAGQLPRTSDAASLFQLQSIPQDMRNTSNNPHGRVGGLAAPNLMGTIQRPGQGRGASAYRGPPLQHQNYEQLNNTLMNHRAQASAGQTIEVPQLSPAQADGTISPDIHSPLFAAKRSLLLRSQTVPRAVIPHASRVQLPSIPNVDRNTHQIGTSDGLPAPPVEQNWRPTGRMRGSLTGSAYSAALDRYAPPTQQSSQPRPPATDPRRPPS